MDEDIDVAEHKENDEEESNIHLIGSIIEYKPGQKYPAPAPANGDRVFYESLLSQRPDSEMAQEWCVAYGILDEAEANRLYKLICHRKGIKPVVVTSPMKPVKKEPVVIKSEAKKKASSSESKPANKKSKKSSGDDILVDTGMDTSSQWEGVGAIGL